MSKPQTSITNKYDRLVALIDMDCFYCQVEEQLNPELKGKPIAVVQHNNWKGGGIIAVNYPARAEGVTRHMRGDEAKEHCPDIELVRVPKIHEKADLSKYRNAGKQVANVLQSYTPLLTRASVDEAYLDLTEQVQNRLLDMNKGKFSLQPNSLKNTYVVGYESIATYVQDISERITTKIDDDDDEELANIPEEDRKAYKKSDIKLLIASSLVSEIRAAVKEQTGYECSAGIAHNKILAKLVCGMNKPNKQTILPLKYIPQLFSTLPVRKVQGLGGKFGEKICDDLRIQFMGDLTRFSKEELQRRYDERSGQWLYNIARGIDLELVTPRLVSKSIGCCKKFPGRNAISAITTLNHWLNELANEIFERLEQDEMENNRRPKQMIVSYVQVINNVEVSSSRTVNLTSIDTEKIVADALDVLKKNTDVFLKPGDSTVLNNQIKFLGFSVGKFESTDVKKNNTIQNMFQRTIDNQKNEVKKECETNGENEKSENIRPDKDLMPFSQIKPEDEKKSIFHKYYEMKQQKQAEEEKALREAQEKAALEQNENEENEDEEDEEDENDDTDEENLFQNDMLLEELEKNQEDSNQESRRSNSPRPSTSTSASTSTSTSSKPNYMETYAEFYKPSEVQIPKVDCTQCGQKVNAHEIQVHMDEHLAFQLTQEEREEFRSTLKRPTPTSAPAAKKSKTSSNAKSKTPTNVPSIQKFLVKPNQDDSMAIPSTSTAEDIETEKCTECGKNIPINELFEHMDYHAAKKLHEELMRSEAMANRTNNNTISQNVSSSKSKKPKKTTSSTGSAVKNIASFFHNS